LINKTIGLVTLKKAKWVIVALAFVAVIVATPYALKNETTSVLTAFLPNDAQSTTLIAREKSISGGGSVTSSIVYSNHNQALNNIDFVQIESNIKSLSSLVDIKKISRPIVSSDRKAVIIKIALPTSATVSISDSVQKAREILRNNNPNNLTIYVSGEGGLVADRFNAFSGINTTLLYASLIVVGFILLITYRSPWLWLVPLIVVAMADQVAAGIVNILSHNGYLVLNGENSGILRVLVFGAGTDYALLIIARYKEELHYYDSKYEAMRKALKRASPAIFASGITVILALLSLLVCTLGNDRSLGPVGAIGILVAMVFGLIVLPAALLLFNRKLFWPFTPHKDGINPADKGLFAKIGRIIANSPILYTVMLLLLLALMCYQASTIKIGGLTPKELFRNTPDAVLGQKVIAEHYGIGANGILSVITSTNTSKQVVAVLKLDPHVIAVTPVAGNKEWTEFDILTKDIPDSVINYDTIKRLRINVAAVNGSDAILGGSTAVDLDIEVASTHDQLLAFPLVLIIVFVVLVVLFRSLVAPLILILSVILSYVAALGVSEYIYSNIFGFSAFDPIVPLLGFVFLVALGIDYNIFLVSRASEEAQDIGPVEGMLNSLSVTGGVITSAGFVLASTFVALSVLQLVALTQIGILVAVGVLIDTLLVRTILIPSIAVLLGKWFWWPRKFKNKK
jgi:putative drug exporter of the RND superfamily